MTPQHKLVLLIGTITAILISIWGIFYNKGTLIIQSELDEYTALVNEEQIQCQKTCTVELKPKSYLVKLTSPNRTPSTEQVYILRNQTRTVSYEPLNIPQFELLTNLEDSADLPEKLSEFSMSTENPNYQIFEVYDSKKEKLTTVATNKVPFEDPQSVTTSSLDFSFIWDANQPKQGFLINNSKKTKTTIDLTSLDIWEANADLEPTTDSESTIDLESATSPLEYRLLTEQVLLIQMKNKVVLYDLNTKRTTKFNIAHIDHVQPLTSQNWLVFSDEALSKKTTSSGISLDTFLDVVESDYEEILTINPTHMYLYNPINSSFTLLDSIPENLTEPFKLTSIMIQNTPTLVLISQDSTYQIIVTND